MKNQAVETNITVVDLVCSTVGITENHGPVFVMTMRPENSFATRNFAIKKHQALKLIEDLQNAIEMDYFVDEDIAYEDA